MKKLKSLLLLLILCPSCSFLSDTDPIQEDSNPASKIIASANLFMSAGLFGTQEFEQYSLSNAAIFYECGILRSNLPKAQSNSILNLKKEKKDQLALGILEIVGMASVSSKLTDKVPANKNNQVVLQATTIDNKNAIVTLSFKEVLSGKSDLGEKLAALVSSFREVVKSEKYPYEYCDNEHFFGIE